MFCCILTTSSDQHIKSIKYHIYKATKSIAKIKVFYYKILLIQMLQNW